MLDHLSRRLVFTLPFALFGLLSSLPAQAIEPYLGINAAALRYELPNDTKDLRPYAVHVRTGIEFNEFLGLEGRLGTGISSDRRSRNGVREKVQTEWLAAAFVKLSIPVNQGMGRPYLLGGHTHTQQRITRDQPLLIGSVRERRREDLHGLSFGGGADFMLSEAVALNMEYVRYTDGGRSRIHSLALGLRTAF
ncbi:porin family protein [Alcanivorax sp. JB21]|uniref:outer membrane beta-barrel protein n=1 Tax=Alcanivorax limicola TaxID=2874102 RepID=UPI001CBD9E60|nr:outer membrane beta-barrel protein [Alcanivorax limicola]MBZ2188012.1 porin family protein [Alcanivorax limicola]